MNSYEICSAQIPRRRFKTCASTRPWLALANWAVPSVELLSKRPDTHSVTCRVGIHRKISESRRRRWLPEAPLDRLEPARACRADWLQNRLAKIKARLASTNTKNVIARATSSDFENSRANA